MLESSIVVVAVVAARNFVVLVMRRSMHFETFSVLHLLFAVI